MDARRWFTDICCYRELRRRLTEGVFGKASVRPAAAKMGVSVGKLPELVYLVIGEFLVFWYAWLLDDAYVYFRYVDNLVMYGNGLVWNAGEFVEGFSSPAWTLLLIPLRAMHMNYWHIVLFVGMISFAACWYIFCLVNRELSPNGKSRDFRINLPLACLALCYGPVAHFTSGTETPLIIVAAAAYAGAFVLPRNVLFQILVGLSPLVRPEFLLPLFVYLVLARLRESRFPWFTLTAFLVGSAGYLVFRVWYYADLLPNTFYLKDALDISQGLLFVLDTAIAYNAIPLAAAGVGVYFLVRDEKCWKATILGDRAGMILCALSVLLYAIKVGGSASHFRYLAFPFTLIVLSMGGLAEKAAYGFTRKPRRILRIAFISFSLLFLLNYPRQLVYHPILRDAFGFEHSRSWGITDPSFHRLEPERFFDRGARITPPLGFTADYLSWDAAMSRFNQEREDSTIYIRGWCLLGYLHPASDVIQIFGLTDPFLSRLEVEAVRPGHKPALIQASSDIASIRTEYGFREGAILDAIREGYLQRSWMTENLYSIPIIEKKAYNDHDLVENLRLSFRIVSSLEY